MAQVRYDLGPVADTFRADRILLLLNRPPERQAALDQFLVQAHSPGSANYHQWVTPEQFGERFGPADSDIQGVVGWLTAHGFRAPRVTKGKTLIEFSGTAGQFREAFHAQIRRYSIQNHAYYANAADLSIPESLAPLVQAISPTNSFYAKPAVRKLGSANYSRATGKATPLFTLPGPQTDFFALAPQDFATEYNLSPLYASGTNGQGQTIGVVISSNIDVSLVNDFRQLFNLSANPPQIVIDGGDPGEIQDADTEAYLDAELSGAVAPAATVNLYISNGSDLQDPIMLAAVRAVEDNQAAVLSLSIEECEASLGPAGNGIWSRLWEQAAAQGQTVLVASGDGGSAGCDFFDFASTAEHGLAVNGIASTPWGVAVGGTDFYYTDYASGAPSANGLWNATNDSANGSLKARLPEQVWDEPFGFNVFANPSSIIAGGGGKSSCGLSMDTTSGDICIGYPKPAWQNAPGVPADGVRDLPDISLFASSGSNRSAYAICAIEGDCAAAAGSEPTVLLVGGTSASTPAMAGIMTLVDQKYGRQGQADFTLYALARQQPAVFHDITLGSNNVPCDQGSPSCTLSTTGSGGYSLQEYPAGPGYDLATGLGSVDADGLVSNWGAAVFTPTTTTLSLSPTTFVHGTQVLVNATVAPSQGTGTPTGDIALVTSGPLPLPQANVFTLSNGSVDSNTFYFPGGTYQVKALYYGDGSFGASASSPVTLTVSPGPSAIDFTAIALNGAVVNQNAQGEFGYPWIFSAAPYGLTPGGLRLPASATGTVTFSDGASSQSQQVLLNSEGTARWAPSNLSVGAHPITVSYSGDASYQPSTTGPLTVSVVKGAPIVLLPEIQTFVPAGGNLHVTALIGTGFGTPPTGNINFSLGNASLSVPLVSTQAVGDTLWATGAGTFSNLSTAGSFTLTVDYPGDADWNAVNKSYSAPIVIGPSALLPTSTTLTVSPPSITRLQFASMTATVQGGPGATAAPTGNVIFYADGEGLVGTLFPSGPAAATATLTPPVSALSLASGANQVVAVYSGDNNYNPSTSSPGTLNVDLSYFSLASGATRIVIPSGGSSTAPLNLLGIDGFNQPVSLSCVPSSGSLGCTVNPATPTVSGNTAATLTVNAFVPQRAAGLSNPDFPAGRERWLRAALELTLGMILLVGYFTFTRRTRARLRLIALLGFAMGCGGSPTTTAPPQPPSNIPTPPGAYSVLVSGTAHGTVRNIRLEITVQ